MVPYIHDRMPQYNKHTSGDTNAGFTRQIRRLVPRFSNEKKYKGIGRFGTLVCGIVLLCCFSCLCSFRIGAEYSSRALSRQYTTLAARRGVGGVGGRVLCPQNSGRIDIGIRNQSIIWYIYLLIGAVTYFLIIFPSVEIFRVGNGSCIGAILHLINTSVVYELY